MKAEIKVSVVQFAVEWLDPDNNLERIVRFVEAEAREGAELITFPELANIGYITPVMPGDPVGYKGMTNAQFAAAYIRASETIPGPTTEALSALARKYGVYVVVGISQKHPTIPATLYNSEALIGPHGVVGVHHKMHIPLNEKHYFYPGNTAEVFKTELGNIGLEVCYDGRFPEISRILALKGAEIICCGWNIPGGMGPITLPKDTLYHRGYTRAQENGVFFISTNRSGFQGETKFAGHSTVAAPNGTLIAVSETDEEDVIRVTIREDDLITYRASMSIFRDRRPELYSILCEPFSAPYRTPQSD